MKKYTLFIIIAIILSLSNIGKTKDNYQKPPKPQKDKSVYIYTIDGFEKPGEWNIKYSKFRSAKWKTFSKKDNTVEPNKDWYGWFPSNSSTLNPKEILPTFINLNKDILKEEKTILGLKARWDIAAYNWISIEPNNNNKETDKNKGRYSKNKLGRYPDHVINQEPTLERPEFLNYNRGSYILIPGGTEEIALFVWASNKISYDIEFHIEDINQNIHILKAGNTRYAKSKWNKIKVKFPSYIMETMSPNKLKKIRLVTNPKAKTTGSFIYLDYLHGVLRPANLKDDNFYKKGLEQNEKVWANRISN